MAIFSNLKYIKNKKIPTPGFFVLGTSQRFGRFNFLLPLFFLSHEA